MKNTYTLDDVLKKIADRIDIVYIVDVSKNTYVTLKDNEVFHKVFGTDGSYNDMMFFLFENSVDKKNLDNAPYSVFSEVNANFNSSFSNTAKVYIEGKEYPLSLKAVPMSENEMVLIMTVLDEEEFIQANHSNQQYNAIKSAYLFSMIVDLNADKCGSINMSEIDNIPASQPQVAYSSWRKIITNMFMPEDKEMFIKISDPVYLREYMTQKSSKSLECQMRNLEGKFIWVRLIFKRINTGSNADFCFIFMVEDINDSHARLVEELKRLETLANSDSLTNLLNHRSIEYEINRSITDAKNKNYKVSLIIFDIDYFKKINDTYGHATGDYVLKKIASIARKRIISCGGKIGRWGGEEFVGVIENSNGDITEQLAENLRKEIEAYNFEKVGKVTCSFGVIEIKPDETTDEAFNRVDAALYQAKNNGRNRVCVNLIE